MNAIDHHYKICPTEILERGGLTSLWIASGTSTTCLARAQLPQISLWSAVAERSVDTAFAGPATGPHATSKSSRRAIEPISGFSTGTPGRKQAEKAASRPQHSKIRTVLKLKISRKCPISNHTTLPLFVQGHTAGTRGKFFFVHAGFSLIELLVVVGILGILLALAVPPIASVLRSSGVTNAGDQVIAALSQARQSAISQNRTVEVRLYQYVDPAKPQDSAGGRFQAVQLFLIDSIAQGDAATPIGRMVKLSGSTYIAPNAALSSILDPGVCPPVTGASLGHRISPTGLDYQAATFRFYPDGSTDLPNGHPMYLTLVPEVTSQTITTPPENFATIVVQPTTGKAQLHRP